jgi:beta-phosphoglucomutase-like phosphatase (HAD superfamily)
MPLKAIIFDMDGVISDTQVTHADVESRVLAEIGIQIAPEEITRRFAGVTNREWFETLVQEHHKAANVNQLIARKW